MFPIDLQAWAARHGVSAAALVDLAHVLGADVRSGGEGSEARAQSEVRLAAPRFDMRLFRNNVGVLKNEAGRPVRYGLANDSPALNKRIKSSDLVGWRRRIIGPDDVGAVIAQVVTLECKPPGWSYRGDEHEQAQLRWISLVVADGGLARFVTGAAELDDAVNRT